MGAGVFGVKPYCVRDLVEIKINLPFDGSCERMACGLQLASVGSKTMHAIDVMYISLFDICRKSMIDMMFVKGVEIEMGSNPAGGCVG
ncbi:hypothetical protein DID88_008008 [Monilinia fructigena]|uniref:Uncharacterized protein n=1 Tax=Monilinia fructigena TaxID=38457 RepID=A0A395J949_9HELO|nr:hypothetical protein DID88_008008 [Monilinia fructigena]